MEYVACSQNEADFIDFFELIASVDLKLGIFEDFSHFWKYGTNPIIGLFLHFRGATE